MPSKQSHPARLYLLTPIFGSLAFISLFILSTLYYPGGSQADLHAQGYSWLNNYWCNLLNVNAMNGQPNPARPIAITAMVVLAMTLSFFWYIFPKRAGFKRAARLTVQISGILSMTAVVFLFTGPHDLIVNGASFFGLIATIGTFVGLRKLKLQGLFGLGMFNLALVALNNILYYGPGWKDYLPLVQKVAFLCFLLWICLIDIYIYRNWSLNASK